MNLPTLTIPQIPLPFEIPAMMHPAIVHFAVALPVIIILIELINLGARRRSIGSISFVLLLLMAVVYLGAYLTGSVDANNAKDALGADTKSMLEAHKNGGVWLVYGAVALLVIKMISAAVNRFPAKIVFLLLLGLFFWGATGVVKKGCALTYKHGVNVKVPIAKAVDALKENVTKDIEKKAEEVKKKVSESVESVKDKAKNVVDNATKETKQAAEEIKTKAKETVEKVEEKVQETTQKAKELVEPAKEKIEEIKEKAKETIEKTIQPSENTPQKVPVETPPAG